MVLAHVDLLHEQQCGNYVAVNNEQQISFGYKSISPVVEFMDTVIVLCTCIDDWYLCRPLITNCPPSDFLSRLGMGNQTLTWSFGLHISFGFCMLCMLSGF